MLAFLLTKYYRKSKNLTKGHWYAQVSEHAVEVKESKVEVEHKQSGSAD